MTIEQRIELLKSAKENALTEDTIKNLAGRIIQELEQGEQYEMCGEILKLREQQLKRFSEVDVCNEITK